MFHQNHERDDSLKGIGLPMVYKCGQSMFDCCLSAVDVKDGDSSFSLKAAHNPFVSCVLADTWFWPSELLSAIQMDGSFFEFFLDLIFIAFSNPLYFSTQLVRADIWLFVI